MQSTRHHFCKSNCTETGISLCIAVLQAVPTARIDLDTSRCVLKQCVATCSLLPPGSRRRSEVTHTARRLFQRCSRLHTTVPAWGMANQDDMSYYLYQILTFNDYNTARRSLQWVLETCMLWQGGDTRQRYLAPNSFQQLCPLRPGYVFVDWTV